MIVTNCGDAEEAVRAADTMYWTMEKKHQTEKESVEAGFIGLSNRVRTRGRETAFVRKDL
jgi:hypothetical protein